VRNPIRSEAEAFSFVLVCVVLFTIVAFAGVFFGGWVALGVFLVLVIGLAVYIKAEPKEQERPAWPRRPHDRRQILVVANETVAGRALRAEVLERAGGGARVLVVCPALNSPIRHWTSDEDHAHALAQERLDESLAALGGQGIEATGEVGDADPIQAIDDALRTFDPDEIVISTHPPGRSNWLEKEVVSRARERYPLPITHVVVDLEQERGAPPATGAASR
jgi:GABA permease